MGELGGKPAEWEQVKDKMATQLRAWAETAAAAKIVIAIKAHIMSAVQNPERILWGTDWPHPNSAPTPGYGPMDVRPFSDIDDGRLLNQLPGWAPEASLRKTILVDNPARLYGF